MCFVAIVIV